MYGLGPITITKFILSPAPPLHHRLAPKVLFTMHVVKIAHSNKNTWRVTEPFIQIREAVLSRCASTSERGGYFVKLHVKLLFHFVQDRVVDFGFDWTNHTSFFRLSFEDATNVDGERKRYQTAH
mmetsp:Transcript_35170/g.58951  ORF Transcript_35170/g.58951 Transcript_35170/m.58951 type:complete len:124 (+) Transcript_35170:106-477(+)